MFDIAATTALLLDMSQVANPQDLLRLFLVHANRAFHVDKALVLRRDGLTHPWFRIVLSAACGERTASAEMVTPDTPISGGILSDLLYEGRFVTVTPPVFDGTDPAASLLIGCRSLVAFPLFERGDSVGMVVLLGPTERECSALDLSGLAVVGALLQRAEHEFSLGRQLETTCRDLDAELAAVASVQRWLLPSLAKRSPGVDVASVYRTAHHASGDYYDASPLSSRSFGIVIADVSGHGAAAAVLMAILRTVVHGEVDRARIDSPAALLDRADEHFCSIGLASRGAFITAFSGTLDTETGGFRYSSAGHPPPRVVRAADGAVIPLEGGRSVPLGILSDHPPRVEESVLLGVGDLLVTYTDGITEARSRNGELFGEDRLDHVLRRLPRHMSPEEVVRAITQAVDEFTGNAPPDDDQALLLLEWQGRGVGSRSSASLRVGEAAALGGLA